MSLFGGKLVEGAPRRLRWAVQPIPAPEDWSAALIPQTFPVPADRRKAYTEVMAALRSLMPETKTLNHEAFVQMDRIQNATQAPRIRELGSALGDYGLGYYPDQPPPATWTREEMTALFPPAKLRPLFTDVMRAESTERSIAQVSAVFAGSGAFTEAFCVGAGTFYREATERFKPLVASRKLRMFPYYATVLTGRALAQSDSATLQQWTCDARLYVRESVEDGGVLVLRAGPLLPFFKALVEKHTVPDADFVLGWPEQEVAYG